MLEYIVLLLLYMIQWEKQIKHLNLWPKLMMSSHNQSQLKLTMMMVLLGSCMLLSSLKTTSADNCSQEKMLWEWPNISLISDMLTNLIMELLCSLNLIQIQEIQLVLEEEQQVLLSDFFKCLNLWLMKQLENILRSQLIISFLDKLQMDK